MYHVPHCFLPSLRHQNRAAGLGDPQIPANPQQQQSALWRPGKTAPSVVDGDAVTGKNEDTVPDGGEFSSISDIVTQIEAVVYIVEWRTDTFTKAATGLYVHLQTFLYVLTIS